MFFMHKKNFALPGLQFLQLTSSDFNPATSLRLDFFLPLEKNAMVINANQWDEEGKIWGKHSKFIYCKNKF